MKMIKSPSGASLTCPCCGTIYDNHPLVGEVPPVGDGCEKCDPESVDEEYIPQGDELEVLELSKLERADRDG